MSESNARRRPRFELFRAEDPKGVSLLRLPGRHEHHRFVGHVYVIEFGNGTIKVGRTANPFSRISKHAESLLPSGHQIVKAWVSIAHRNPAATEKLLIAFGRANCSGVVRDEYFHGLRFADVVAHALRMDYKPIDPDEIAELVREERERARAFGHILGVTDDRPRLFEAAQAAIAAAFGRKPDGTHRVPVAFGAASPEQLRAVLEEVALAKGCPVDDVLGMTWLEILSELMCAVVRVEALQLKAHALNSGHLEILETAEDMLTQAEIVAQFRAGA